MLAWMGPDSSMYTVQPDGKIKNTTTQNAPKDNGKPMDGDAWRFTLTPGYELPFNWNQKIADRFIKIPDSQRTEYQIADDQLKDLSYEYYDSVKPKYIMPNILFSKEDIQNLSQLSSQVHPLATNMMIRFISGEVPIGSQWDSYIANLKS